ncbi:SMP-30/gluconolactonase/LRE family protein [Deinococcus phoenicis]|nr:hypothetical protein [Deinococcus phoenicis]
MKRLHLPGAMLGLTVLLTACPGPTLPSTPTLTVKLEGLPSAPVTVTNTTTQTQVFSGMLAVSKTFSDLKAGDVFRVEGGAVNGFTAPAAQTVTLEAGKTVTLAYTAASPSGTPLDPARFSGKLSGWTYGALTPDLYSLGSESLQPLTGSRVAADGTVSVTLPQPAQTFSLLGGCTFSGTSSVPDVAIDLAEVVLLSAQGDVLGSLTQAQDGGKLLTRLYSATEARFSGTAQCSSSTLNLDLTLKAGWNAVVLSRSGNQTTLTSIPPGTPVSLRFVQADRQAEFQFADPSALTLRAGQPVTREVTVYQDGGLSGQVSLSTDLPGVVVTPGTLTLPSLGAQSLGTPSLGTQRPGKAPLLRALGRMGAQAVTTTLTFSLDDSAATYSGPLNLLARQGGQTVGGASLYADIRVPSVQVGVNGPYGTTTLSGYQGAVLKVPLSLTPQDGLTGSVTVTLNGLPAELSVSPVTVPLTANATTHIELPVQVAPGAALGEVRAQVGGGKVSPTPLTLQIKPARTLLDVQASPSSLTPAAQGVWIMAAYQRATTGTATPQITFRRYLDGQAAAEVTLNDVYGELLRVPGGGAYAISAGYAGPATAIYHLKDDGSVTRLNTARPVSGPNMLYGAVDAQGRLWYTGIASEGAGYTSYGLYCWDPATGESRLIDSQNAPSGSVSSRDFITSGNGRYLFYKGGYNSKPLLIDTETSAITPLGRRS